MRETIHSSRLLRHVYPLSGGCVTGDYLVIVDIEHLRLHKYSLSVVFVMWFAAVQTDDRKWGTLRSDFDRAVFDFGSAEETESLRRISGLVQTGTEGNRRAFSSLSLRSCECTASFSQGG